MHPEPGPPGQTQLGINLELVRGPGAQGQWFSNYLALGPTVSNENLTGIHQK